MNTVDYVSVYDKVYDEVIRYINNKSVAIDGIEFTVVNFDDDFDLIEDYVIVDCLEEDKIDEYLKNRHFKYKEDSVVLFSIPIYIRENLKSYNYDPSNIWEQFEKDCPRSTIYINDNQILSKQDLTDNLPTMRHTTVKVEYFVFNLVTVVAMLCNQSSYAFPYIFLNKLQSNRDSNVIASNCSDNRIIKIETIMNDDQIRLKFLIKTDVIMRNIRNYQIDTKANITLILETNYIKTNNLDQLFKKHGMFFINFYSDK